MKLKIDVFRTMEIEVEDTPIFDKLANGTEEEQFSTELFNEACAILEKATGIPAFDDCKNEYICAVYTDDGHTVSMEF